MDVDVPAVHARQKRKKETSVSNVEQQEEDLDFFGDRKKRKRAPSDGTFVAVWSPAHANKRSR
jgi:hypothetical protein